MCSSRFHFPVLLGSTVVTRFTATMRTLTPDPLLQHRVRYPWFTHTHFQTFRLHPPHAPLLRQCFGFRADLAPRFAFPAIGGSSDFAHCSQSHQSHKAVSSSLSQAILRLQFYGLSVHFQLLSTSRCRDAVTFSCLAGSSAREGLPPSGARWLPSARARTLVRSSVRTPLIRGLFGPAELA